MGQEPPNPPDAPKKQDRTIASLRIRLKRALVRIRRLVPPGLRLVLGIGLIGLGILGFLPVLGFWMIPLGVAVAMLDIAPIWRWFRGR